MRSLLSKLITTPLAFKVTCCKDPMGSTLERELNYLASRGLLPKLINGPCEVVNVQ